MCMDVSDGVINIIRLSGEGISFVCLQCRVDKRVPPKKTPTPSRGGAANLAVNECDQKDVIRQLADMVTVICVTVQTLADKMEKISSKLEPFLSSVPMSASPALDESVIYNKIREQCRELREREHRQRSVIVRGVPNTDMSQVQNTIQGVSNFLIRKDILIENLKCIDRVKGIYKVDIPNDNDRVSFLRHTKKIERTSCLQHCIYTQRLDT